MKELVCNYALIRFLPYRETGEFVNIGVVLYAPEINHFDFKLTPGRNRRVREFFPEMDSLVYSAAIKSLGRELVRQREQFRQMQGLFSDEKVMGHGLTLFRSMLRRRETLLHFAEPGMKLGIPQEALDRLFAEYVLRRFAFADAYQETVMRRRVRAWLKEWGLQKCYKADEQVGDEMFHVTLPFVHFENNSPLVAIKPLDLIREKPTDVYDHGGRWIQRFRRLADRGSLPKRMVVPVRLPTGTPGIAAGEVVKELEQIGVNVADIEDVRQLRELAEVKLSI